MTLDPSVLLPRVAKLNTSPFFFWVSFINLAFPTGVLRTGCQTWFTGPQAVTQGPVTVCPVLGLPGRINSTCIKGGHTLAQAQQTLETRSVYLTVHCLNQDVVAFVTRVMQMSFPETQHPAPHSVLPETQANGGCPEN